MKKFARFSVALISLAVLSASIYGILHKQQIFDFIALRNYQAPERISELATETTMTDGMRKVFYINHPRLDTREEFRNDCPSTEQSIVLGCYVERKGIFLHDVKEERLSGVVQVTAAHEALHAQYDRLSKQEQKHIDELTAANFANLSDSRIKQTIEQYRAKDPSVVPNELHSILGTEVRNLSPELEDYYKRYFDDRGQIVAFSEKYEQTFVELANQAAQYDKQLNNLKETIDSNKVEIEGQSNEIETQKARLDSLINSDRTEEYNAAVPQYNSLVNSYNASIAKTKELINQYNAIVEKRNSIATAEQELIQAINSNIETKQQE
jgi:hypothetical protein